jgi:hypothetical protein
MNDITEKYLIADREFVLRDDLTFKEINKVEEFTNPFKPLNKTTISSNRRYSRNEVIEIVKILLSPIDGGDKESVDWLELTEEKCVLIIADYLKKKALENIIITKLSKDYEEELKKQSVKISD